MGTEYTLFNHQNATYYDLGRGPWGGIDFYDVYDSELFYEVLKKDWSYFMEGYPEEEKNEYFKTLCEDLKKFVGSTPEKFLEVQGDSGDAAIYAGALKYTCIGSRYSLGDSVKNKEYIKETNERRSTYVGELSPLDLEILKQDGWNMSKI